MIKPRGCDACCRDRIGNPRRWPECHAPGPSSWLNGANASCHSEPETAPRPAPEGIPDADATGEGRRLSYYVGSRWLYERPIYMLIIYILIALLPLLVTNWCLMPVSSIENLVFLMKCPCRTGSKRVQPLGVTVIWPLEPSPGRLRVK